MFEETREYLKKIGMPTGDLFDMPSSKLRFPDGGAFRIEVPTVNTAEAVSSLLDTATKNGITINRVTETYGMFRHTRQEIKNIAACAINTVPSCYCLLVHVQHTIRAPQSFPNKGFASATVCVGWNRSCAG